MTVIYTYDNLIDDWKAWTGILNESQAKELVKTMARRSFNQPEETDMAKNIYNVTVPATIIAAVEASDDKDAVEKFRALAKAVFGSMFGVVSIVGDPKVALVTGGKAKASEDEEEDDEDEDDDDEDEDEDDEDEEDDEKEEDEDEDEKPAKKSDKKSVKKSDDGGKKKIKIKLKG